MTILSSVSSKFNGVPTKNLEQKNYIIKILVWKYPPNFCDESVWRKLCLKYHGMSRFCKKLSLLVQSLAESFKLSNTY